jgi:3-oxoacyl-[acyl-carrier-protein] synthase II
MTVLALAGFSRLGALSTRNDTPEQACAPFDAQRDGTVVGEGCAMMVLETLAHAQQRGARILAEIVGYGLTCDAFHIVAPDPNGGGAARAMRKAMREAHLAPEEVDWVCAHGTATVLNDAAEARAIHLALGERARSVAASSLKGALGHMLGAAGAISAVAVVQAMQEDFIPPTLNYRTPDPACDLDVVPNVARPARVRAALVNAIGFGGQNGCLALRRWGKDEG